MSFARGPRPSQTTGTTRVALDPAAPNCPALGGWIRPPGLQVPVLAPVWCFSGQFCCLKGVSKSVQVLLDGIEAVLY